MWPVGRQMVHNPFSDAVVNFEARRHLSRRIAGKVGGVSSGFNHCDLDSEIRDLLREAIVKPLNGPFRRRVEADKGPRLDSETAGDADDVSASGLARWGARP